MQRELIETPMGNLQMLETSLSLLIQKILEAADINEFQLQLHFQLQIELHVGLAKPERHPQ